VLQSHDSSFNMESRPPSIKFPLELFINGEFRPAVSGKQFPVMDPSTEEVICHVAEAAEADVDIAVAAANAAFRPGSPWRTMDASARGRLLYKLADLVERDASYIAALDSWNNGKPYADATRYDIPGTSGLIRYYAGWADKIHGKTVPVNGKAFTYTRMEPLGVVAAITPWNFPSPAFAVKV
jgi:acyl-CoA reductase-like NAD-dependent aldehyde dehydrogenase